MRTTMKLVVVTALGATVFALASCSKIQQAPNPVPPTTPFPQGSYVNPMK